MAGQPTKAKHRRVAMLDYLFELIGNDCFTTHEVWQEGLDRVYSGETWPPYLKAAFKRLRNPADLAFAIRVHPRTVSAGATDDEKNGVRLRSHLWMLTD